METQKSKNYSENQQTRNQAQPLTENVVSLEILRQQPARQQSSLSTPTLHAATTARQRCATLLRRKKNVVPNPSQPYDLEIKYIFVRTEKNKFQNFRLL